MPGKAWFDNPANAEKVKLWKERQAASHTGKKAWNKDLTKDTDSRLALAAEKSSETMTRLYADGKIIPWNKDKKGLQVSWRKGLNKNTDVRIANSAEKGGKTIKRLYIEGKLKSWNKNLTKNTDTRLAKAAKTMSVTKTRLFYEGKLVPHNKNKPMPEAQRIALSVKKTGVPNPELSKTRKQMFSEGKLIAWNKNKTGLQVAWNKNLTKDIDERIAKYTKKSGETQARLCAEGKLVPWIKGLTKETDIRLANAALKISSSRTGHHYPALSQKRKQMFAEGKLVAHNKGKTKETDEKTRLAGLKVSETRKRLFKEGKLKFTNPPRPSPATIEKWRKNWESPEYKLNQLKKLFGGRVSWRKKNKREAKLETILQTAFPNEWKYVGDGQIFIGSKVPDFMNVNGKKLLIELDGDYWHQLKANKVSATREELEKQREAHFAKYGFKTLIVRESELKDESKMLEKINEFQNEAL
jgi:G:T-mismatch repair DNA endonuclease (very short patch repair protein)